MDLCSFLKLGIKSYQGKIKDNSERIEEHRNEKRAKLLNSRRNMGTFSPITPKVEKKSKPEKKKEKSRLEILREWQKKRNEELSLAKKNKKPLFKVSHASIETDLNKVYNNLKGLPIKVPKKNATPSMYKFASSTQKFRPPVNIKPLEFQYKQQKIEEPKTVRKKLAFKQEPKKEPSNLAKSDRVLRSHKTTINKKVDNKVSKSTESSVKLGGKTGINKLTNPKSTGISKSNIKSAMTSTATVISKISTNDNKSKKNLQITLDKGKSKTSKRKSAMKFKVTEENIPKTSKSEDEPSTSGQKTKKGICIQFEEPESKQPNIQSTSKRAQKRRSSLLKTPKMNAAKSRSRVCTPRVAMKKKDSFAEEDNGSTDEEFFSVTEAKESIQGDKISLCGSGEWQTCIGSQEDVVQTPNKNLSQPRRSSRRLNSMSSGFKVNEVKLNIPKPETITKSSSPSKTPETVTKSSSPNKTPENNASALVYVSPFVTMSRGKSRARDEIKSRISTGGFSVKSPHTTNSRAGSEYFSLILKKEVNRIQDMCDEWENYKNDENVPEEAQSMINVAIGQSNLLLKKRLTQFKTMIESCKLQNTTPLITCTDLHGYWESLLIQVSNIDSRFENLSRLKANNWEEIIPEEKEVLKKKATRKPKPANSKPAKSTSTLRDAIRAAKKKKLESIEDNPVIEIKTPGRRKKSLLQNAILNSSNRRSGSPGLFMIQAAQISKNVTPGKSILKNNSGTSSVRKAVAFRNSITCVGDENKENDDEIQTQDVKVSRRTLRGSKLF